MVRVVNGDIFLVECVWVGMLVLYFFFFQAEDGIRDRDVTGVQTCALPISSKHQHGNGRSAHVPESAVRPHRLHGWHADRRSEERRVGKECRSGWSRYH